jgi:hypothetical protein
LAGKLTKRAVVATSTACPAIIGRLLIPGATKAMKVAARCMGARVVDTVWPGMIANSEKQRLSERQRQRAYRAGEKLIR